MSHPADVHPFSTARAIGIDVVMLLCGGGAIICTFATGPGAPRWQNLVFAPAVIVFAAITLWLAVAEIRTLGSEMPPNRHPGELIAARVVAISMCVVVVPMLLIMPFIWLTALFS
jgi:hypothetical protein